ncbi:MAG TPA: glycyl-radical enzyme activating protein [Candidatus Hydrogenedentes bacterium]|nr:glycyl-radical enzyme activating protein [Candidatus Hydrogenedentota bacterium]
MKESSLTTRGVIFDIQRMCVHDGPGIRTTVFLKGCTLRCLWCHNPEGRESRPQLGFSPGLCIDCGACFERCPEGAHVVEGGMHTLDRGRCAVCFGCVETCCADALEQVGRECDVEEVLNEVMRDMPFYRESGGGMTLSGGEPLVQLDFATGLLREAKVRDLHTCVETCGHVAREHVAAVLPNVDIFLFDYKETSPERHREWTGQSNNRILENLRFLDDAGATLVLRCPIIPTLNLREDHLEGIALLAGSLRNCRAVHVMPHHALGESKRERLGLAEGDVPFPTMTCEEAEGVVAKLRLLGVEKVLIG